MCIRDSLKGKYAGKWRDPFAFHALCQGFKLLQGQGVICSAAGLYRQICGGDIMEHTVFVLQIKDSSIEARLGRLLQELSLIHI